jgi:M6 family metalloprotease-like protein
VFLVDFDNLPSGMPDREYSKSQFEQLLFENDLESNGATLPPNYDMSVRDYFNEISNDSLEVFGDNGSIVDWTEVSESYSYYVDGEQGTGSGAHGVARSAAALVVEIAMEVESDLDFSEFDGDGDGAVDVVILIVEGWGNGDNDQFWPHMSLINSGSSGIGLIDPGAPTNNDGYFSLDGVTIKKYIVIPEQFHMAHFGVDENYIHPIGTICHELGHVLGLPDLYDTSENSAAGIGDWGLMGSGNWQRQTSPAYMSAWSRHQLGFINPMIIDAAINSEEILLPAESGEAEFLAMILPMDSNMPQEYLILENRQELGADQYLERSGLLVWHIDETITGMYPAMNSVNVNPEFYGVNLLQADGEGDLYRDNGNSDSKDPYPGSLGVEELDGSTNPNTDTYSYDRDADGTVEQGGASGIAIGNIAEDPDGLITFTVTNPNSKGEILGYDEGGYDGVSYHDEYEFLQWAGVRFEVSDTALLSGIETVFPPSFWSWDVTDYTLNIWEGWINNTPQNQLYTTSGYVNWNPDTYRNGGWAHISLLDEAIVWNAGEIYYVEINFNGTGGVYPVDIGVYSNSVNDNLSFYRGVTGESCKRLTNHADADWNIRAVMSGIDDFSSLSTNIPEIPQKHEIYANYPNPFNPVTTLSIYLTNPSAVSYIVFDLRGRHILQKEFNLLRGGRHRFEVNMEKFSSGVYFYQFTINDEKYSPYKMLLLK